MLCTVLTYTRGPVPECFSHRIRHRKNGIPNARDLYTKTASEEAVVFFANVLQRFQNSVHAGFGITKQHMGVIFKEQRVLHTSITGIH